jgi:hypothetical protein
MKLYVVSEYVGGMPMDSRVVGVYDSVEKAKEAFKKHLDDLDVEEFIDDDILTDSYAYWDADDFFGGLEIKIAELNKEV